MALNTMLTTFPHIAVPNIKSLKCACHRTNDNMQIAWDAGPISHLNFVLLCRFILTLTSLFTCNSQDQLFINDNFRGRILDHGLLFHGFFEKKVCQFTFFETCFVQF